jgi:hypothetical protein
MVRIFVYKYPQYTEALRIWLKNAEGMCPAWKHMRFTARQTRTLHEVLEFCDIVPTCRHPGKAEVINLSYVLIGFWDTL